MKSKAKLNRDEFLSEEELLLARKLTHRSRGSRDIPKEANSVDRAKYQLCLEFVAYMIKHNLPQRQLAKMLDVSDSRVSEITHYNIGKITVDKLIELLERIHQSVVVKVACRLKRTVATAVPSLNFQDNF